MTQRPGSNFRSLYNKHVNLMNDCPTLPCSQIDPSIYEAILNNGQLRHFRQHRNYPSLASNTYNKHFSHLVECDFAHNEVELRNYDTLNQEVQLEGKHNVIIVPRIKVYKEPAVTVNDHLIASRGNQHWICTIKAIEKGDRVVFVGIKPGGPKRRPIEFTLNSGGYNIRYASSGGSLRNVLGNLDTFHGNSKLKQAFFAMEKFRPKNSPIIDLDKTKTNHLERGLKRLDPEQRQAVENIMTARCRPRPYFLFGPPGTGKTTTILELVRQIYVRKPKSQILVTASSNNCVDKLATDLSNLDTIVSMIRLISFNRVEDLVNPQYAYTTDTNKIHSARILVTTNNKSGIVRKQFDYVIVDEAGQSAEPETLGPILRLKPDGCLVLAGDHHQLGPTVKCKLAMEAGLGESLFARLSKTVLEYKLKDGKYNERFITQLKMCYRCDSRVMRPWNELYYKSKLQGMNTTPKVFLDALGIKNPSFVLKVSFGKEDSMGCSFSRSNSKEAKVCIDWVLKLYKLGVLPHQVGILTPYKAQKGLILTNLMDNLHRRLAELRGFDPRRYKNCQVLAIGEEPYSTIEWGAEAWMCKVDTVDGFQGDEREFMIYSSVRAPGKNASEISKKSLRFLEDDKRFNVALSRAKWFNIVIGHPAFFRASPGHWQKFWNAARKVTVKEETDGVLTYKK